jgi:hypothetical protein
VALFDPNNTTGEETKAALALATLLSTLPRFQELAEDSGDAAEARKHATVGVFDKPADGLHFSIDELAELGFQARINRVDGSRLAVVDGYGEVSSAGALQILFRRYVRESEDEQDAYLFFWDRLDALQDELAEALSKSECPRVQQGAVTATSGPYFGTHTETPVQGEYLHAAMQVEWGDAIDQG